MASLERDDPWEESVGDAWGSVMIADGGVELVEDRPVDLVDVALENGGVEDAELEDVIVETKATVGVKGKELAEGFAELKDEKVPFSSLTSASLSTSSAVNQQT
ncbi:MAG: hypothetical protein M1821_003093 [Bathelium mastoideum]|nr:MAG: hypothetical protein M1821_003093 [Bathelium mastoideum]